MTTSRLLLSTDILLPFTSARDGFPVMLSLLQFTQGRRERCRSVLRAELHEVIHHLLREFPDEFLTVELRVLDRIPEWKGTDVLEGIPEILDIIHLNLQIQTVTLMLPRQEQSVFEVIRLTTDFDRRLHIETPTVGLHELIQFLDILELRVAVQKKGRVVCVRTPLFMERLEIAREIVNPLCVQEFPNHCIQSIDQWMNQSMNQ